MSIYLLLANLHPFPVLPQAGPSQFIFLAGLARVSLFQAFQPRQIGTGPGGRE